MPIDASPEVAAPLNAFLRAHRVVRVIRQWCEAGPESSWAFCVEYLDGPPASGPFAAKGRCSTAPIFRGAMDKTAAQVKGASLTAFQSHAGCLAWRRRVVRAMETSTENKPRITQITRMKKAAASAISAISAVQVSHILGDGPQAGTACCAADETSTTHGWLVANRHWSASSHSEPRVSLFVQP